MKSVRRLAGRLLGGKRAAPTFAEGAGAVPVTAAPAVAGFVYRLPTPPADFHLSARLASVAHLNTPAGRLPARHGRPQPALKAIPKLQPACRKRSAAPPSRAAAPAPAAARAASVVALPKRATGRCVPLSVRIAEAA